MGQGLATVTSKIGPGFDVTALALTGITELKFNFVQETAEFVCDQGNPFFDITANSTFTITVSGVTYTITIAA